MRVPKSMHEKYGQIAPLITDFCRRYLSDDYEALCLMLLEKLCRMQPSPLMSGRANTWAACIVYAIAANNFIVDKSQPIHMTADELASPFGLAKSTVANKAAEIARMCGINRYAVEWLPEVVDSSPFLWFLEVNGLIMDIRSAPLWIQIQAYEKGLIPYVPALRQTEKASEPAPAAVQPAPEPEKQAEAPAEPTPSELEDFSDIYRAFGLE